MTAPAPRVLVAVSQSGYGIATKLLAGCDADVVTSYDQGTQALTRVLGVRGLGAPLSDDVRSGLHTALQTIGAEGLVDLTRGALSAWEREALLEMRTRCWPRCKSSRAF